MQLKLILFKILLFLSISNILCNPKPAKHVHVPKKEIPTETSFCYDIPISLQQTCYSDVTVSEPHDCNSEEEVEECNIQYNEVTDKCHKIVKKDISYACPALATHQKLCYDVPITIPKMCTMRKAVKIQEECEKDTSELLCKSNLEDVNSICYKTVNENVNYECKKIENTTKCHKHYTKIPAMCIEEIQTKKPQAKNSLSYQTICTKKKKSKCKKTVMQEEEYPCTENKTEKVCQDTTKLVSKPCTTQTTKMTSVDCSTVETRTIQKKCPKTKMETVLKTVCSPSKAYPQNSHKYTSSNKKGYHNYDNNKKYNNNYQNNCHEVAEQIEKVVMEDCNETMNVTIPKLCNKEEQVDIQTSCSKTEIENVCFDYTTPVQSICKRQVPKIIEYDCNEDDYLGNSKKGGNNNIEEEECRDVPIFQQNMVYKNSKATEQKFACEATEETEICKIIPIVKNDTCQTSLLKESPYNCTHSLIKTNCEYQHKKIRQPCLKDTYIDEEYSCPIQSTEQKCEEFPVYQNVGKCYTTIDVLEEFDCKRNELFEKCRKNKVMKKNICHKNVQKKQPYTCYTQSTKPYCQQMSMPQKKQPQISHYGKEKHAVVHNSKEKHTVMHNGKEKYPTSHHTIEKHPTSHHTLEKHPTYHHTIEKHPTSHYVKEKHPLSYENNHQKYQLY